MLSASANKLSRLKEQAEEYAALIMEELDPEKLGYIEVWFQIYLYYYYTRRLVNSELIGVIQIIIPEKKSVIIFSSLFAFRIYKK